MATLPGVTLPGVTVPGETLPVARVLVATPLPHLDRPFDYAVPPELATAAVPGARVKVRFAGRDLDGVVLARLASSEHLGRLDPLRRLVSPEPVLAPDVARLLRLVADRYAGTAADVLRLAVPPRHAEVERREVQPPAEPGAPPPPGGWSRYPHGEALLHHLAAGATPRVVWTAPAGDDWPALLATLLLTTASAGRGAIAACATQREVARLDGALRAASPHRLHAVLTAESGPRARYRAFLQLRRGSMPIAIGTRAAAFAPVQQLGLVSIWDDGADSFDEPRAPYPHAREVLLMRAHDLGTAAVIGGYTCTSEAANLVENGWARPIAAERVRARAAGASVRVVGDAGEQARDPLARSARLPSQAWRTARDALARGPVLVQVPRTGYLPSVRCATCRARALCGQCGAALHLDAASSAPRCGRCARVADGFRCATCGDSRLRASVVGARRTAEEFGRTFPGVRVISADAAHPVEAVTEPALVVATPGAEPPATGGYAAALLLDAWAMLDLPFLRAGEEALRRWLAVAALVRPASEQGAVLVVGADASDRAVQALVRHDPVSFARAELAERRAAGFPPVRRWAELSGAEADVEDFLSRADLGAEYELLGPVVLPPPPAPADLTAGAAPRTSSQPPQVRLLVKAPSQGSAELVASLRAAAASRSARRVAGSVRVRLDPYDLG